MIRPSLSKLSRIVGASILSVLLVGSVSACSPSLGLATSGPVQELDHAPRQSSRAFVDPQGPVTGASPETLIRGFLAALPAGPQSDGFATARQFLTSRMAQYWKPASGVIIMSGDPRVEVQANEVTSYTLDSQHNAYQQARSDTRMKVRVSYEQLGRVDKHGLFHAHDSNQSGQMNISLLRVAGEWRIDNIPNDIVLTSNDFTQSYREVQLYFADTQLHTMIPDTRWLSWRSWRTEAVRELIHGPSQYLVPACYTVDNDSVSLNLDAVTVRGTVAQVTLKNAAASLRDADRSVLVHEIRLTLNDGNSKGPIRVVDDSGADLSNDDSELALNVTEESTQLYTMTQEAIVSVRRSSENLLRVGLTPERLSHQTSTGVNPAYSFVFGAQGGMALDAQGIPVCLNAQAQTIQCDTQWKQFQVKSLHRGLRGEIWAITSHNSLAVYSPHASDDTSTQHGVLVEIAPAWSSLGQIKSLALSPEGSRLIAVLHRNQGDDLAVVSGIVRNGNLDVHSVSSTVVPQLRSGSIEAVSFFNENTAVFAQDEAYNPGCVAEVTGPCTPTTIPAHTKQLVGTQINNAQSMAALTEGGVVHYITASLSTAWRQLDSQTRAISAG